MRARTHPQIILPSWNSDCNGYYRMAFVIQSCDQFEIFIHDVDYFQILSTYIVKKKKCENGNEINWIGGRRGPIEAMAQQYNERPPIIAAIYFRCIDVSRAKDEEKKNETVSFARDSFYISTSIKRRQWLKPAISWDEICCILMGWTCWLFFLNTELEFILCRMFIWVKWIEKKKSNEFKEPIR